MTEPSDLDPKDWDAFRAQAHELLDACIDRMANARDLPWTPPPEDLGQLYAIQAKGDGEAALAQRLRDQVMPYATGNTHPRFFGWVHGTGLASGVMSEMVAAAMNSNCGGRNHGLIEMERAVIAYCRGVFGFPEAASGVLVTGTSQATVIALAVARRRALGDGSRRSGLGPHRLTAYTGSSTHGCVAKAMELLGMGSNALRRIPQGENGLDMQALRAAIAKDRADGALPFAVIGTAGSVDCGAFDDLNALADLAAAEDLWLHVDGAFGAWLRLADDPWRGLTNGIERADSLACDFHKWMYVPYDCGLALIRDGHTHRATFAGRGSYLDETARGLAAAEYWPCDYGVDLSRGSRALKVWAALETYGAARLGQAISENCRRAGEMGTQIAALPHMALLAPVISNLCVFTADERLTPQQQSALNIRLSEELQLSGAAVFSTVRMGEITALRAAIVNHRTRPEDVTQAVAALQAARAALQRAA
ncbi:MAG: pyridoxal-dependent decarboxylase [Mangrovicoccus sp.]|nr:pyridoxal-dependent decarboxylase [Mangrovicoccus sp.]